MKFDLLSIFRSEPPPKRPTTGEMSFADPSRLFPGGYSLPYNPSELVGQRGLGVFDKMRRDDQVKAALTFKRHTVTAAGWTIKVPEGKDEKWEPAAHCRTVLDNIDGSLERSIDGVLTALAYGYSISEKVWAEEDGMIVLKALKTRRPHDWEFGVDVYGNLIELKQLQRVMPVDKFVVYSYDSEFGNWYGTSDLEAAHRAWWTKRNTYQWMAMLLERLGIPPIFALYDPNAYQGAKVGDLKNVLKNMQAATVGVIPRGAPEDLELWSTEIKNGIEGVFIPALDRLDRDISKALLMPGLLGMTADAEQGSMARAKVHFDVFMLVTERTRNEIAQHIITEQLIKPMVALNFGVMEEYPWFEFNPLTDEVRTDLMTTWGTLTGQKVVTSTVDDERHVRTMLQFPELTPEGEAMRAERELLEAEQRQATVDGMKQAASMTPEQRAAEAMKGKNAPPKAKKMSEDENDSEDDDEDDKSAGSFVDFEAIEDQLDVLEARTLSLLKTSLTESRDALLSLVKRDFNSATTPMRWCNGIQLKKFGAITSDLQDALREASERGVADVTSEFAVRGYKSSISVTPRAAVSAMKDKAFWVSGVLKQRLVDSAQVILMAAIKNGEPLGETIIKLGEIWLPYLGDPTVIVDEQQLTAPRLETIVRTNTTEAYNMGRLAKLRDPELAPFIKGVKYSAILDTRTTELCEGLHGLIFKLDDPDLDRLVPPNHFNCRSMIIGVPAFEQTRDKEFATREDIGRALDLIDAGFGGNK